MSVSPASTSATTAQPIARILETLRELGSSVEQGGGNLTVTAGDLTSVTLLATAIAGSDADLLDLWEDTPADGNRVRRYNVLCASGSQLLLHRTLLGPDESVPAIGSVVTAALPYEIDRYASGDAPDDTGVERGATSGIGVFTIPFGPVRSGVVESMLYEIDTAGEDMLLVRPRTGFKRRDSSGGCAAFPSTRWCW